MQGFNLGPNLASQMNMPYSN